MLRRKSSLSIEGRDISELSKSRSDIDKEDRKGILWRMRTVAGKKGVADQTSEIHPYGSIL